MRIKNAWVLRLTLENCLSMMGDGEHSDLIKSDIKATIDAIDRLPEIEVVPIDEYKALERRFRHLVSSDYIASFDAVDPITGKYKRDIAEAGKFPVGGQRERWLHVGRTAGRNFFRCSGCACVVFTKENEPEFPQCPECFALMYGGVSDG